MSASRGYRHPQGEVSDVPNRQYVRRKTLRIADAIAREDAGVKDIVADPSVTGFRDVKYVMSGSHGVYFSHVQPLRLPFEFQKFGLRTLNVAIDAMLSDHNATEYLAPKRYSYYVDRLLNVLWTPYRQDVRGSRERLQKCLDRFAAELTERKKRHDEVQKKRRRAIGRRFAVQTMKNEAAELSNVMDFFAGSTAINLNAGTYYRNGGGHSTPLSKDEALEFEDLKYNPCILRDESDDEWRVHHEFDDDDVVDGYYAYLRNHRE